MIPVEQTVYGRGEGNCLSAAIASVIEKPLLALATMDLEYRAAAVEWDEMTVEQRIEFQVREDGMCPWLLVVQRHLAALGWFAAWTPSNRFAVAPSGYAVALGDNAEGVGHACVYLNGRLVWDPNRKHPVTFLRDIHGWVLLLPMAPGGREEDAT